MRFVDLTETQLADVEEMLNDFDEHFITYKMDGNIQIGIEEYHQTHFSEKGVFYSNVN